MEDSHFERIKKDVEKAIKKINIGGLKGQALHKFLRAAITSLYFKWIEKKEHKIDDAIKKLDEDIHNHLVLKAEVEEEKAIRLIIKDHVMLFTTIHSVLLFEKHDIFQLKDVVIPTFRKLAKKKGLGADTTKEITKALDFVVEKWEKQVNSLRKSINAVWQTSQGHAGTALTGFNLIHGEDNFFSRLKERHLFKDTMRDEKIIEAHVDKLMHIKDKKDLDKITETIKKEGGKMANEFNILTKFLMATWEHLDTKLAEVQKLVSEASGKHELPEKDLNQMNAIYHLVQDKLNRDYLHALRIEDKQLEAYVARLDKEVNTIKK
jgi:hypothetical protein